MALQKIQVRDIEIRSFAETDYIPSSDSVKMSLDAKVFFETFEEEKELSICFNLKISCRVGDEELSEVGHIITVFTYYIPEWTENIKIEGDNLKIEEPLRYRLLEAAYNGTRGIIAVKASDSFMSRAYLPFIDFDGIKLTKEFS